VAKKQKQWTLRQAAAELGVTASYLRQMMIPETIEKPLVYELTAKKVEMPSGQFCWMIDDEELERLRDHLEGQPDKHKKRRVSGA
jgi:hypothetical protein